ncbi:MAG TPA: efflux RND transporter periplasmic adaptor subunit [Ignavibacteriaceae bacterium]|nr:efflux RND transporter periplasmic adaptor subunit [Ignavibacteriaceae bacterium]
MANGIKKSKKKIFIFGGLGLLLVVVVLLVIFQGNKEEIIPVVTEKVQKRTVTQTVTATGKINPEFQVKITPEVTGEIVFLPVKEGDKVKKGDVLIKIKADAYQAQKQRAEAALQSSRALLSQRKAELEKVSSDYKRVSGLHAKNLVSEAELEAAKSQYLSVQAMYEAAQASVLQSDAALREALEQLYKTTITSPMNGTISILNVELGERVLGSGFSQGTDLMTVSDLANMEAIVDVDENDVPLISVGDTSRIKVDAFGDRVFAGVVTQIGNSAKQTGFGTQEQVINFEVKIKLIDIDKNLRPGMSCNAKIETETKENVVTVPIQSVTARSDFKPIEEEEGEPVNGKKKEEEKVQEIVFVIDNSKAKSVKVETGISDDNYIEIKKGLEPDVEVVTGSYRAISRELKDGSIVIVENKGKKESDKK